MAEIFSNKILRGGIQREGWGNIANTWLKMVLIFGPLILGSIQLYRNWSGSPFGETTSLALVTVMLGVLVAQSVDLRDDLRGRMVGWLLFSLGVQVVILLAYLGVISLSAISNTLASVQPIKFLSDLGDFSDLIVFAWFVVAGRGAFALTATDAFIVGGLFSGWGKLQFIYEAVITSYFAIFHTLSRLLREAWLVGKNRYRLLRRTKGRMASLLGFTGLFGKSLITALSERSELAESVLTERKWYSRMLQHPVRGGWNVEDTVAVVILGLFVLVAFVIWR